MMSRRGAILPALLLALAIGLLLSGCNEPRSAEQYCTEPPYAFTLAFADTLTHYDISFYTAGSAVRGPRHYMTKSRSGAASTAISAVRLVAIWTAPSGASSSETVYLPLDGKTVEYPYRSGLVAPEAGEWKLEVSASAVSGYSEASPLNGLGVILTKTD